MTTTNIETARKRRTSTAVPAPGCGRMTYAQAIAEVARRTPPGVCPNTHHAPYPSAPVHCPEWCVQDHDDRLWMECCNVVVHSILLNRWPARGVNVYLTADELTEDQGGVQPARVMIQTDDDDMEDAFSDWAVSDLYALAACVARAAWLAHVTLDPSLLGLGGDDDR